MMFSKKSWKVFDQQFAQHIEGFRVHRENVEKEVDIAHMSEAADSRALILMRRAELERQEKG